MNSDNLTALADRTYNSRPNVNNPDWSFDAVDAARLDMPCQVSRDLATITENYQSYISGLANLFSGTTGDEPYIEQSSTVATALDEALATDYDGTLRIAPAWPSGWDVSGTVYIQGGSKVDVQVEGGVIATAAIQAGTTRDHERCATRGPASRPRWSTAPAAPSSSPPTTGATFSVPVTAGSSYLVEQPSAPTTSLPFAQVTGTQATARQAPGQRPDRPGRAYQLSRTWPPPSTTSASAPTTTPRPATSTATARASPRPR